MRSSAIVSIFTLVLVSSVFAAPIQDSARCSIDGACVEEVAVSHQLKARGCGVYYGSDVYDDEYAGYYSGRKRGIFEACPDENGGTFTITVSATSHNVAESTDLAKATNIAEVTVVAPTPASVSAPHANGDGGLLSGLIVGLLGSHPQPVSGQQLAGSNNDNADGHLINLDLTATVDAGDLLQATATAGLGLL